MEQIENVIIEKKKSFLKDIINIILEPKKVFEDILERQKILVPLLAILIVLFILALVAAPIGIEFSKASIENMFSSEKFLKTAQMSADSAQNYIETVTKYTKFIIYPSLILLPILYLFLQGGIFHAAFKIFSGAGTFKQTLSIIIYSYFIKLVGEIVRTINMVISGNYEIRNSFGLLMSDDKTSFIYNFINGIDFFSIWQLTIIALGLSYIHKISKKKSIITVFALWGIFIIISAVYITINAVSLYKQYGITI